jgi:hypothetical protein
LTDLYVYALWHSIYNLRIASRFLAATKEPPYLAACCTCSPSSAHSDSSHHHTMLFIISRHKPSLCRLGRPSWLPSARKCWYRINRLTVFCLKDRGSVSCSSCMLKWNVTIVMLISSMYVVRYTIV